MYRKILVSILIFLITLEVVLRLTGTFAVYSERIGAGYISYWGYSHQSHYKVLPVNKKIEYTQKEFTLEFTSNSLGMRNRNIAIEPVDSVFRILCLGDSYTEGDGATPGNPYPRQLENILKAKNDGRSYEVINAGKNGSDIVYLEKIFTDYYHQLKPDLVLVALNDTDLEDLFLRGGPERFKEDNTTVFREGPWYLPLYKYSYAFRFIVHVPFGKDPMLLGKKQRLKEKEKALETINNSILSMMKVSEDNGIEMRLIIHPLPWHADVRKNKYLRADHADLKDCFYNTSELAGLDSAIINNSYNLFPVLIDSFRTLPYTEYAWPLNGHFNDRGYHVFTKSLYELIRNDSIIQ